MKLQINPLIFVLICLLSLPLAGQEESPSVPLDLDGELRTRKHEMEKLINEKKITLGDLEEQKKSEWGVLEKLNLLRKSVRQTQNRLKKLATQIKSQEANIRKTRRSINGLNRAIRKDKEKISQQMVVYLKLNQLKKITLFPGQRSLGNYFRNQHLIEKLTQLDLQLLDSLRENLDQTRKQRKQLLNQLENLNLLRLEEKEKKELLDFDYKQQVEYLSHIREDRDTKRKYLGEVQIEMEKMNDVIFSLEQKKTIQKEAKKFLGFRKKAGKLPLPVEGVLLRRFNQEDLDGFSMYKRGVLVRTPEKAGARAFLNGKVAFAGPFRGFGLLVILDHGKGSFSVYGNLEQLFVQLNDVIPLDHVLGLVGYNPLEEDYLFYFETRYRGRSVDPLRWLSPPKWN